jgi:hypothetical protein
MVKRSLNDLRDEMRAVARGERAPSPLPAGKLLNVVPPFACWQPI